MTIRLVFVILLACYAGLIFPFVNQMKNRPVAVKLGYLPEAEVLKVIMGDYRALIAQSAVVKVLFYYDTVFSPRKNSLQQSPEYFNMFKMMQTAVKLDPYNMDAYYFVQAAFTWELHKIKEVNNLLDYGMKYRTWDPQLPFFAAFNAAYFQKDYKASATYMQKAAELSGDPLYTNLAARYFHQSGNTQLGLLFLEGMAKAAKDGKIRKLYGIRIEALKGAMEIERAVRCYRDRFGHLPANVGALVQCGFLRKIPHDPYGGTYYLAEDGTVQSTSKFAFRGPQGRTSR